ncbi:MAG: DUF2997 domain-containing protein [Armatimonadota bacterium]
MRRPASPTGPKQEQIVVTLSPDGSVQTEVSGVKGKSCYDVTRQLEAALGTVTHDDKTAEFTEKPVEVDSFDRVFNRA